MSVCLKCHPKDKTSAEIAKERQTLEKNLAAAWEVRHDNERKYKESQEIVKLAQDELDRVTKEMLRLKNAFDGVYQADRDLRRHREKYPDAHTHEAE